MHAAIINDRDPWIIAQFLHLPPFHTTRSSIPVWFSYLLHLLWAAITLFLKAQIYFFLFENELLSWKEVKEGSLAISGKRDLNLGPVIVLLLALCWHLEGSGNLSEMKNFKNSLCFLFCVHVGGWEVCAKRDARGINDWSLLVQGYLARQKKSCGAKTQITCREWAIKQQRKFTISKCKIICMRDRGWRWGAALQAMLQRERFL